MSIITGLSDLGASPLVEAISRGAQKAATALGKRRPRPTGAKPVQATAEPQVVAEPAPIEGGATAQGGPGGGGLGKGFGILLGIGLLAIGGYMLLKRKKKK
ncbi:MAG: hypothetical protein ABIM19_07905 [candidate division WOR-3 bacterium]